jgi:hypothetical protein
VDARLRGAFADPDPAAGSRKAKALAAELDKTHPDAAGSLREGLEDMFTVRRLGIDGTLARTLVCTNMIESMISIARTTTRNVKRWRDEGDMRRRWCAAGLLEAERQFRRVKGYRQMPAVVAQFRRHAETVTSVCQTDNNAVAAWQVGPPPAASSTASGTSSAHEIWVSLARTHGDRRGGPAGEGQAIPPSWRHHEGPAYRSDTALGRLEHTAHLGGVLPIAREACARFHG